MTTSAESTAPPADPSTPWAELGLSAAEADARRRQGEVNVAPLQSSRPLSAILRDNFFSLTNIILIAIMIVLLLVGKPGDAFFTGGVVIINIIIGIAQELYAKRKLDRIALLTRPRVTVLRDGREREIDPAEVVQGDALVLRAGDQVVVDGPLLTRQRIEVDESLLTGESEPVDKAEGDELLSGSFCTAGEGVYRAEKIGQASYAFRLAERARHFQRKLTPLQRDISILVRGLVTLSILLATLFLLSSAIQQAPFDESIASTAVVISLVPQGLLLMITVAYALGALRIARQGALVQQINAVESLSNVDVLCLDKTGTLTTNKIALQDCIALDGDDAALCDYLGAFVASTGRVNRTAEAIADALPARPQETTQTVPFSSEYKWSGASFDGAGSLTGSYVLGAPEILLPHLADGDADTAALEQWTNEGLRVLLFARHPAPLPQGDDHAPPPLPDDLTPLGWLTFSDELRPDARRVFDGFRDAGVVLKLISGDNPHTVATLAARAGITSEAEVVSGLELAALSDAEFDATVAQAAVFGRITPEQKQRIVQSLRRQGHYVAMIGDGVNDVLSLKQAQMGIAMESGSPAARGVADMVLLNDEFGILPEAILEGQRILNAMQDVMRLFLTRTLYAALLIVIAGFLGSPFPFTPRTNYLLTSFPVGYPAAVLTLWARAGRPRKDLLTAVSEFVFPAGVSITVVTLTVYLMYLDRSEVLQRTVLTSTAMLCGIVLIVYAQFSRREWEAGQRRPLDRRRIGLAVAMLAAYLLMFPIRAVREFFDLTTLAWADIGVIAAGVAVWAVLIQLLWRYDVLRRMLIPTMPED